jgi:outer membrane protein assembly factor BamB
VGVDERVWVVSEGGNVTAVDPTTGELTRTVTIPTGIQDMAPLGDGTYWAADPATGQLLKLILP